MASFGTVRRAKSTRSIRTSNRPSQASVSLDPQIARHHATAAATRAMLRSSDGGASDSTYNHLSAASQSGTRRQLSIRYADDRRSNSSGRTASLRRAHLDERAEPGDQDLPSISEFGGLDNEWSSQPSSYHRLRKTKSMFTARQDGSTMNRGSFESTGQDTGLHSGTMRKRRSQGTLRRSMSFLRGSHQPARFEKNQEAAIQMARRQYALSANDEARTQNRVSSFGGIGRRHEHKPFRKTFRAVSESGLTTVVVPATPDRSKRKSLRGRAVSISHSVKHGIKRVFGLSRSAEGQKPGQQSDLLSQSPPFNRHSPDPPSRPVSQHDTRYLSEEQQDDLVDDVRSLPKLPLRSVPSPASTCRSRSRVTSWADSSVVTTNIEHQKFEPSTYQTSYSVDSRRLYSALMKRISKEAEANEDEKIVVGTVKGRHPVPERTSSVISHHSRRTVRRVPSEESMASPGSFVTAAAISPSRRSIVSKRSRTFAKKNEFHAHMPEIISPTLSRDKYHRIVPNLTVVGGLRNADANFSSQGLSDDDKVKLNMRSTNASTSTVDSASVYSRTTGGHSPTRPNEHGIEDDDAFGEPGMATIYESLRTPYCSPRRAASNSPSPSRLIQPSGDFKQWMSSQIARIEDATPTRGHRREPCCLGDDDGMAVLTFSAADGSGNPWEHEGVRLSQDQDHDESKTDAGRKSSENTVDAMVQSNFSRPLARSSSLRTIVPIGEHGDSSPESTPLRTTSISPVQDGFAGVSPMQLRPNNVIRDTMSESQPLKRGGAEAIQKRRRRSELHGRYSNRLTQPGREGKLGAQPRFMSRTDMDNWGQTNENLGNQENMGCATSLRDQLQDPYCTMSSNRMVEWFLNRNSRREAMAGKNGNIAEETQASDGNAALI